jgi:hypothetical protein
MFGLDGKVVPARAAGALLAHVITTRFPGPGSRIIAENLRGAILATQQGLITPILTGPEAWIRAIAAKESLDLSGILLIGTEHSHA